MTLKITLARFLYYRLAQDRDLPSAPGEGLTLEFGESDIGVPAFKAETETSGEVVALCGRGYYWGEYTDRQARRLARWILWDWWAKATWFGLKRRLWYWGLLTYVCSTQWDEDHDKRQRYQRR